MKLLIDHCFLQISKSSLSSSAYLSLHAYKISPHPFYGPQMWRHEPNKMVETRKLIALAHVTTIAMQLKYFVCVPNKNAPAHIWIIAQLSKVEPMFFISALTLYFLCLCGDVTNSTDMWVVKSMLRLIAIITPIDSVRPICHPN